MTAAPLPLVHDCDPGTDDAVALLLALHSPELGLLAVTTTHGNLALATTTRNALELLAFAGRSELPLYAGAAAPLVRPPVYAPEIHGDAGLGGATLPGTTKRPGALHAALALIQLSLQYPGELTVCATGPVTNLALAQSLDPGFLPRLRQVVVMGGSIETGEHRPGFLERLRQRVGSGGQVEALGPKLGNVTALAEFNAYADPHALRVLLDAGEAGHVQIVLFGLNLTRQVRVTRERVAALQALGTPAARLCADMLAGYLDMIALRGQQVGALHDPCTVVYLLRPDLFTLEAAHIRVNIDEEVEESGMTTREQRPPNVQLATHADEDGVYRLLHERLG
ncbi:nucleoside hydrolase [Deinococcus sp.]|uniref:nucleoside hydrolase n=1 Tax=Deinococcus sp. TaxID=47478 RepID=UPI003CC643A5